MVGFVRDPDTQRTRRSAPRCSSSTRRTDIIGRKQPPTVREIDVDSTGLYRICGLPADMTGKVQVFRNGVSSGEVPVEVDQRRRAARVQHRRASTKPSPK